MDILIRPFSNAAAHYQIAYNGVEPENTRVGLCGRIGHLIYALSLSIPIINIIIEFIAGYFRSVAPGVSPLESTALESPSINFEFGPVPTPCYLTFVEPADREFRDWERSILWGSQMLTPEQMKEIIREGIRKNYLIRPVGDREQTFLIEFSQMGKASLIKASLEEIKDPYQLQELLIQQEKIFGNTALLWAIANAHNKCAMQLLHFGGKGDYLNVVSKVNDNSAIHLIVAKGCRDCDMRGRFLNISNLELLRKMVELKCNLNIQNRWGYTPLHIACLKRDSDMIRILLNAGADRTLKDHLNRTPRDLLNYDYESARHDLLEKVTDPIGFHTIEDFNTSLEKCESLLDSYSVDS